MVPKVVGIDHIDHGILKPNWCDLQSVTMLNLVDKNSQKKSAASIYLTCEDGMNCIVRRYDYDSLKHLRPVMHKPCEGLRVAA